MSDLTMETNHWVIEDPAWKDYSKSVCTKDHYWIGYYGSNYFLHIKGVQRFGIWWPNIAEHFYSLQWQTNGWDTIFASYSLSEIQRFFNLISWPLDNKKRHLRLVDEVTKEIIDIDAIIENAKE